MPVKLKINMSKSTRTPNDMMRRLMSVSENVGKLERRLMSVSENDGILERRLMSVSENDGIFRIIFIMWRHRCDMCKQNNHIFDIFTHDHHFTPRLRVRDGQ
jgi:hypothetical protein